MVLRTGGIQGSPGLNPPITPRPEYKAYRSPHAPPFEVQTNFRGITQRTLSVFGKSAALFGVAAGVGALYFASGVPRVRVDIMEKIPFIGSTYHKEIPPEDNPF